MDNWFLYFSVITVNLYIITSGFILSWNSPVIPKLLSNDTSINPTGRPITLLQVSTLTSLFPLGSLLGPLLIGKVPDIIGRKTTLIYLAILTIISFIALFFATHIYVFFIFLSTVAITTSAAGIIIPIYVTEIAEDRNRGKLGCLMSVGISFGQFLAYLIGPSVSVNVFALICGTPALLSLIFCTLIPESPVFLSSKNDKIGVLKVLKKLRACQTSQEIELEYNERQHILQTRNQETKFISIFKSKSSRKGFLISLGVKIFQQSSGLYIVTSFLAPLLNEVGSNLSGERLAVIIAAGKIVAAATAFNVIEKVGRKILILCGNLICGTSMFILGLYFYFKNNHFDIPDIIHLIPILCIVSFLIAFTFGLGCVPSILVSELLPNKFRAVGSSIIQLISSICSTLIAFVYPIAAEYLGLHYCMFAFSFFNLSGSVFTFLMLPETKGRSFSEIENILNT